MQIHLAIMVATSMLMIHSASINRAEKGVAQFKVCRTSTMVDILSFICQFNKKWKREGKETKNNQNNVKGMDFFVTYKLLVPNHF